MISTVFLSAYKFFFLIRSVKVHCMMETVNWDSLDSLVNQGSNMGQECTRHYISLTLSNKYYVISELLTFQILMKYLFFAYMYIQT